MMALIVPLLTIVGIRDGIVGTLTARLLADPVNRELVPRGTRNYDAAFLGRVAALPDTAFLSPKTRSLSATVELAKPGHPLIPADLVPTGPGDPLLAETAAGAAGLDLDLGEAYVSEDVAERLSVSPGDRLKARVGRVNPSTLKEEIGTVEFLVLGVVPRHRVRGLYLFCSLSHITSLEHWRDGYSAPALGLAGPPRPDKPQIYGGFRLYSKDLDGVDRLRRALLDEGVDTSTRAADIQRVKSISRAFDVVFLTLFAVVGGGAFASAASGSLDQVAKMRRSLSVLALLGLSKLRLLIFTMFQAALTGLLASGLAAALCLGVARFLNRYFASDLVEGGSVCVLSPWILVAAGAVTVAFMTAASGCAYFSLAEIEPSEGMRDV